MNDRHVVVTGGTGSLGAAVVGALLDKGAVCHVPWLDERELERFGELAEHPGVELRGPVDLTDEAAVADYYASLPELWGSVQVAGGFAMAPLCDTSLADLQRMLMLNVTTCFLCCREAVRRIRATVGQGGRLVNVAARPALVPTGGMVAYATAKSAVAAMTLALAEELAAESIWVNAVVPSIMDTPANRAAMPDADHELWPGTGEVAATIAFLTSVDNVVTRGALVPVYGAA